MTDVEVNKIIDEVVTNAVKEVGEKGCVCGAWTIRISRTPKVLVPAKTEVFDSEQKTESPQNEPVSV